MFPPHPHIFLMHFFYQTAHIHQDCTARNSHLFFFYIYQILIYFFPFSIGNIAKINTYRYINLYILYYNKYICIYRYIFTMFTLAIPVAAQFMPNKWQHRLGDHTSNLLKKNRHTPTRVVLLMDHKKKYYFLSIFPFVLSFLPKKKKERKKK